MQSMRTRAKENLPHVLLTLLSIIQALALELFWTELQGLQLGFEPTWTSLMTWTQVATTFLGILVIWIVYATTVMRFSWVPSISDSVVPFFVGLLQFVLIESLGTQNAAAWFFSLAVIVLVMHAQSHAIMRRARQDPDNAEFFRQIAPATKRDFVPPLIMVLSLLTVATYMFIEPGSKVTAGFGYFGGLLLLVWHLVFMNFFWRRTMGELKKGVDDPQSVND